MMMQLSGILPKDGSGFPGPPKVKPHPQWEYIEFGFIHFAELQAVGRDGWNVFCIIPMANGWRQAYGKRELRPPEAFVPKAVVDREVRESD